MASESLALHYWQLLTGPAEQAYDALEEMLGTQEENEYLDFTLFFNRQHAEKRLAKSLCAFANSDGGVLVFGVRTEKTAEDVEKARELVPIPKVKTEASWLKDRARTIADPPIDGIEVKTICPASLNGTGFIVCFAPGSQSAPHRSSNAAGNRWLMRTQTGSVDIPPTILKRMFHSDSQVRMYATFEKYSGHPYAVRSFSKRGNPFKAFTLWLHNLGEISAREAAFTAWLSHGSLWQRDSAGEFQSILPATMTELKGLHPTVGQSFDFFVEWKTKEAIPLFHLRFFAVDLVPQTIANLPVADLTDERKSFYLETSELIPLR